METKDIIIELRKKQKLTQESMAKKLFVTRQAVSRWENGETIPNTETLKLMSKEFNVSVNTLLGSPQRLICQCCGMPLDDITISKDLEEYFNEEYCKWCYKDGKIVYSSLDELLDFLIPHMASIHHQDEDTIKAMLMQQLPQLNHWKKK